MELSRSEYPSMLSSLQPTPAVAVLRERLRKVQTINNEMAEWLQERRTLEAGYALGLSKLAKKNIPGDHSDLGIFQPAWARILQSTAQLSAAHLQLSQKIESEVERPLKEYAQTNKEWAGLKTFEANLAGIAKQFDAAEHNSEKLRKKGPRAQASRVAEAAVAVEKAAGDWDSQAPFIFEKFQAVDESRCINLRDSLTRYHTLEVDQAQKAMQLAEESLSTVLDLNTNDEIKSFVEAVTHGRPKIEKSTSRAPSTAAAGMPSSTPSIVTDDSVSVQSAGSGSGGGSGSLSHGLGLRRLGTVLRGRNRNSTVPYMRSGSPVRSSEKLPSRDGRPPVTPASPRGSEFTSSSSRNLEVPGSPPGPESGRPSTPKTNGLGTADGLHMLTPTVSVTQDEPQKDEEGYTIPPPVTDIGGVPLTDDNVEQTQPQFKLEIKNDVIQEEEEEADAAISKVATHLRMQPTVSRKTRGRRDARDVRNTVFFPPGAGPADPLELLNNSSPPLTPQKVPRPTPPIPSSEASDTQSIRSSRSVTSVTAAPIRHPELHESGLSSSLIETVSAQFAQGIPSRVIVTGEIALAYNPNEFDTTTQEIVKMDNFSVLEKVAPNPAFINPLPDKVGEYSVALANIHKTSVAFKYQIHVDENTMNDYLPIILSPVWRIEPHQASVIINYRPNPNYHPRTTSESGPITLRNVIFVTGIEGLIPTSCQSKPVGTFSRDLGRIAWKVGEIVLDESATGKLLARFAVDANTSAGVVAKQVPTEMRWEVVGEDAKAAGSALSLSMWIKDETDTATITDVDPFADDEAAKDAETTSDKEGSWKQLSTLRKISSGKYCAP